MGEGSEKVQVVRMWAGADSALTFKMNVAVGLRFAGMDYPVRGGGIVLQTKLRTELLRRRRAETNDPQPNDRFGAALGLAG